MCTPARNVHDPHSTACTQPKTPPHSMRQHVHMVRDRGEQPLQPAQTSALASDGQPLDCAPDLSRRRIGRAARARPSRRGRTGSARRPNRGEPTARPRGRR
eukprot:4876339-Alexandrium_andersonii.AAC.1